ncbi:MAG: hypothetical protein AAF561_03615 [Planctomycetota bacterium]
MTNPLDRALTADRLTVRAKVLSFIGRKFHVYDESGNLLLFCKLKAFKLKEDIVLFASEAQEQPLLQIKATQILDFTGGYTVVDPVSGDTIGTLRRKGMSSMVRDSWEMLDANGRLVARIAEDSTIKALVRRFVEVAAFLMPQAFHGEVDGRRVFEMKQNFNPIVQKLNCDFSMDSQRTIDRRLGVAAAVLLIAIEGRQN